MKLATYLEERGMKPGHFADQIGVSRSTISRILNESRKPNIETMARIAAATRGRVKVADFLDGDRSAATGERL